LLPSRTLAFKGKPRQPYRIELVKDNVDDFEHAKHGKNVFDAPSSHQHPRRWSKNRDDLVAGRASRGEGGADWNVKSVSKTSTG
jgi:hypothetical protein